MSQQASGGPDLGQIVNGLAEGYKVFDRYTLMKVVGRGRMSVVWLAWDERLDRDVALKFLPAMTKPDASALANLKREVRKLQDLKHAQIVALDNVENDGQLVAISMDYVEGACLADLLEQKTNRVFATSELTDWLQQLCSVLEFAHNEGPTPHGDLKPSDVLIDQKGTVRVTDFGLERHLIEFATRATDFPNPSRDLQYMSPQLAGGEQLTYLDDIYSLGAGLYELLTSKPPFYTGDLMKQLQNKVAPPMITRRKELRVIGEPISRVWEETVAACLSKDPTQRPQSIPDVVSRLELKSPAVAVTEIPAAAPAPAKSKQNPMVLAAVVAVVILLLGVAGLVLGRKSSKADEAKNRPPGPASSEDIAKATADAEAKAKKEFEAKTKQIEAELAKAKKAEADRLAQMESQKKAAQKAEQEAALLKTQLEAAQKKAATDKTSGTKESDAAKKAREDLEAKLAKAQADAAKAADDAKKREDEMARIKIENEKKLADLQKQQEMQKKQQDAAVAAAAANAKKKAEDDAKKKAETAVVDAARKKQMEEEFKKQQEAKRIEMAKLDEAAKKKLDEDRAAALKKQQEEAAAVAAAAEAKKFAPNKKAWLNTLGLTLVQVGNVHFAATETRYIDFENFFRITRYDAGNGWRGPGFKQTASHPVVNVSWSDAQAFCKWLTDKERKEGAIPANFAYRLPTDLEWSRAVGLPQEEGPTPLDRDGRVKGVYPWGGDWPPPIGAGNYQNNLTYDRFPETSPVGSFSANPQGLYDLGGNVWEWCEDWSDASQKNRVLRGGSWFGYIPGMAFSSYRRYLPQPERRSDNGFRVVLAPQ